METPPDNSQDYLPASTIITLDRPIPLLREPIPAGPPDHPSAGTYVLAFRDPKSWKSAYIACHSQIIRQCEGGARIGCAITASTKCKPPWWQNLIGGKSMDLKEREKCEEMEMEACFAAAKRKCVGFAIDKCLKPFADARIALNEGNLSLKEGVKLICLASVPERSKWVHLIGLDQLGSRILSKCEFGATSYRGSELIDLDANGELNV